MPCVCGTRGSAWRGQGTEAAPPWEEPQKAGRKRRRRAGAREVAVLIGHQVYLLPEPQTHFSLGLNFACITDGSGLVSWRALSSNCPDSPSGWALLWERMPHTCRRFLVGNVLSWEAR